MMRYALCLFLVVSFGCQTRTTTESADAKSKAPTAAPTASTPADTASPERAIAPDAQAAELSARADSTSPDTGSVAGDALPTVVPLLDPAKGEKGLADYRAVLAQACSLVAEEQASALKQLGIADAAVCATASTDGRALASGAFVNPGDDELLLDVASGSDQAEGDRAVVLLRRVDDSYRWVAQLRRGRELEPRLRLARASQTDLFYLCERSGQAGVYPGVCGFWARGVSLMRARRRRPPRFLSSRHSR